MKKRTVVGADGAVVESCDNLVHTVSCEAALQLSFEDFRFNVISAKAPPGEAEAAAASSRNDAFNRLLSAASSRTSLTSKKYYIASSVAADHHL